MHFEACLHGSCVTDTAHSFSTPAHGPGLPTDNDFIYCKHTLGQACYFYRTQAATHSSAKSSCQAMGGNLVAWNSDEEQLEVERYFASGSGTARLSSYYWIGLERNSAFNSLYRWPDGTEITNGYVSNAGECFVPDPQHGGLSQ